MNRDFEDQKIKLNSISSDHQQMQAQLKETEEKLREANFQRQQLQKRVAYLEELNNDLQAVSDANKKLEGQLKRIGELESMLNMAAEERDQLIRKVEK
jgi:Tfp pilus assembly protein PilO